MWYASSTSSFATVWPCFSWCVGCATVPCCSWRSPSTLTLLRLWEHYSITYHLRIRVRTSTTCFPKTFRVERSGIAISVSGTSEWISTSADGTLDMCRLLEMKYNTISMWSDNGGDSEWRTGPEANRTGSKFSVVWPRPPEKGLYYASDQYYMWRHNFFVLSPASKLAIPLGTKVAKCTLWSMDLFPWNGLVQREHTMMLPNNFFAVSLPCKSSLRY